MDSLLNALFLGSGKVSPAEIESGLEPDRLKKLSNADLRLLRDLLGPQYQQRVAPYEHRSFAREFARENPLLGIGLLGVIPGYQFGKAAGLLGARTPPSLEQMKQGYIGMGEGLLGR